MFHGSESHYFGSREIRGRGHGLGSGGHYIDVRQCKSSDDFAEKGGFLVIRFDQSQGDGRGPELQGEGGETGTRADVKDAHRPTVRFWMGWGNRHRGGVGVLRLRHAIRFADDVAPLRMTIFFRGREKVLGEE